jgi:hypothetical protein
LLILGVSPLSPRLRSTRSAIHNFISIKPALFCVNQVYPTFAVKTAVLLLLIKYIIYNPNILPSSSLGTAASWG